MSWFSQFLHAVADGATGKTPPTHADQTPLHQALDQVNAAGAAASSAITQAAKVEVDTYLVTKIGPVGAEVADAALQALIAEATSRLSTSHQPS